MQTVSSAGRENGPRGGMGTMVTPLSLRRQRLAGKEPVNSPCGVGQDESAP